MNIKTKQINITKLLLAAAMSLSFVFAAGVFQKASAEPSASDPVVTYCNDKVKKASLETCKAAAEDSRNKASWNCEAAKDMANCIQDKAISYIKKANTDSPTDSEFKKQLDAVLDKVKGNRNEPSPKSTSSTSSNTASVFGTGKGGYPCGNSSDGSDVVYTKFDFGCLGPNAPGDLSPIMDLLFSLIRFMSAGVGLLVIGAIILAGIQYSSSEGNPEATQQAKQRIQNAIVGLIIYIFAYAFVQYLVPGGVF